MIVNRQSLTDALARLQHPEMGAVSYPYRATNTGFIPLMQTIEYNMLTFVQGAYNVFSAIALWGGFIAVKREAFLDAGKFSVNAITEDMDLAFKLNQKGVAGEPKLLPDPHLCSGYDKQMVSTIKQMPICLLVIPFSIFYGAHGRCHQFPTPTMVFESLCTCLADRFHRKLERRYVDWTIGVTQSGNALGLSQNQVEDLAAHDLDQRLAGIESRFREAGAHYVVKGIWECTPIIDSIGRRLAEGDHPLSDSGHPSTPAIASVGF